MKFNHSTERVAMRPDFAFSQAKLPVAFVDVYKKMVRQQINVLFIVGLFNDCLITPDRIYRVAQKNVYTLAAVRRLRQCLDADGGHFEHLH